MRFVTATLVLVIATAVVPAPGGAGVGNGNASAAMLDALGKASKAGIAVVRSSRVLAGPIGRNVETDDDTRGFVAADTLPPMKARILLMLALAAGTKSVPDLQAAFYEF